MGGKGSGRPISTTYEQKRKRMNKWAKRAYHTREAKPDTLTVPVGFRLSPREDKAFRAKCRIDNVKRATKIREIVNAYSEKSKRKERK